MVSLGRLPPVRRGSEDQAASNGIGMGHPGQRRRGSDDRAAVPASPLPGQRYESSASTYQQPPSRRPSGAAEIPPIVEPDGEDDAYGGMKDEVLTSPVIEDDFAPTIPPVITRSPSKTSEASPSKKSVQLSPSPSTAPTSLPPDSVGQPSPKTANGLVVPSINEPARPRDGAAPQDRKRRVSFVPPPLSTGYSRDVLLTPRTGLLGSDVALSSDDDAGDAIMANVEELIEGFDWTATAAAGDKARSGPDAIEGRLLDELAALESANIHAFLESDDRVDQVLSHIDDALKELDDIDMQLTGYRMQLNVSESLVFIDSRRCRRISSTLRVRIEVCRFRRRTRLLY